MCRSIKEKPTAPNAPLLSRLILKWYDRHRRDMPWRASPGRDADPYHVWVSEVMLQQTTVATVGPYFQKFLSRWPTVHDLAGAKLDDVLHAWQGLGYYARARNLHKCAHIISSKYKGCFPNTESELIKLPGVGQYTAAAIAAIAFGRKATVVDGNVERVMARLHAVKESLPEARDYLRRLAAQHTPEMRCGDYVQAVMDLGATVCMPSNPNCGVCPWTGDCMGLQEGIAADLPIKPPKKNKSVKYGVAYWILSPNGSVFLRRRANSGLLGGMMEVPSTNWTRKLWSTEMAIALAPVETEWQSVPGIVRHTFTHFHLELKVLLGEVAETNRLDGIWCAYDSFDEVALPTLMKKVIRLVLSNA